MSENRQDAPVALRATYNAFPKTAWFSLGMAIFFLLPLFKFLLEGVYLPLPYLALGIVGFLVWPLLTYLWVGELVVTDQHVRGRQRIGRTFEVARSLIAYVEPSGSRRMDTLGVEVVMRDGGTRKLVRLKPYGTIATLVRLFPPPRL